MATHWNN